MHLTDYVLLALAAAAGLAASIGGVFLTAQQPPIRAAKAAFYIAAVCFGLLGVLWGMQANNYPIGVRLGAAGITAAIAAIALTYVLSLVSDHYTDDGKRITTVRTAFSATESIKLWPPFLGGTDTLNLDNVAILRVVVPLNDQITLILNSTAIRMRDINKDGFQAQGIQLMARDGPEFLFDRTKSRRHEISVEGRTFVVILQDIFPRTIEGVANPIEYVFGISEK